MSVADFAAAALRTLPPETAHRLTVRLLAAGLGPSGAERDDPRLSTVLPRSGLALSNPIGLAAGFDKNAEAATAMLRLGFGFVECGTVTPRPQAGNPRPRLFRLEDDRAVINRMGFNNLGLERFVASLARAGGGPLKRGVVGANVGANKDSADRSADYVAGVRAVWPACDYITINISSPNTPGLRGLQEKGALEDLLGKVGAAAVELGSANGDRPVFLKVAPDLDVKAIEDVCEVALAASKLSGLIVSNTTLSRPESLVSPARGEAGGLSGKPLFDLSTRVLATFSSLLNGRLDLIGVGGVASGMDAWAKFQAGADAVQLYSALVFEGPGLVGRIKRDLVAKMTEEGVAGLSAIKGAESHRLTL